MPSEKEVMFSVTPSACQMFQEVVSRLHQLDNVLAKPLFEQSWKNLATRLDQVKFFLLIISLY